MTKTKIFSFVGGLVLLSGLTAGGFFYLQNDQPSANVSNRVPGEVDALPSDARPVSQNIPLNQNQAAQEDPNALSVRSNTGNNSAMQAAGTQQTLGQSTSGSAPSQNPFDPSKYGQYEKYKTESTALFSDVQMGTGAELKPNQKAAVFYRGWLTNGTKFDESRPGADGKMEAFVFTLGAQQVIPGWEQGLAGMKVGGVRLLIVPPAAGYGATGQGSIPPNAVLVFQVQLADVQ